MADAYFNYGPQNPLGPYATNRSSLDGVLGTFDGISSIVNSAGRTVGVIADARSAWADGQIATDNAIENRERNELELQLDRLKVDRGDNLVMYAVLGACAVAAIVILK